jgi:hypothetical protein
MGPCAIYVQCRRSGPGEWEDPTLRVDVARLRHGIYVVHDRRINVAGLLVERIPDLVAWRSVTTMAGRITIFILWR